MPHYPIYDGMRYDPLVARNLRAYNKEPSRV